eukprot:1624087-Pyramimonas_sp.AAC.1
MNDSHICTQRVGLSDRGEPLPGSSRPPGRAASRRRAPARGSARRCRCQTASARGRCGGRPCGCSPPPTPPTRETRGSARTPPRAPAVFNWPIPAVNARRRRERV